MENSNNTPEIQNEDEKAAAQVIEDLGPAVRKYRVEFYSKIKDWLKNGKSLNWIYRELEIGEDILGIWRRKSPTLDEMVRHGLKWGQGWHEEWFMANVDNPKFHAQAYLGYLGKRYRQSYSDANYLRSARFKDVKNKQELKAQALRALAESEISVETYDKVIDSVLKDQRVVHSETQVDVLKGGGGEAPKHVFCFNGLSVTPEAKEPAPTQAAADASPVAAKFNYAGESADDNQ